MAQPFIVQRKEVMQKAGIALAGFGLCLLFSSTIHAQHAARTIEVHAHRFAFEPSEIRVTVLWQRPWPYGVYSAREPEMNASETVLERGN